MAGTKPGHDDLILDQRTGRRRRYLPSRTPSRAWARSSAIFMRTSPSVTLHAGALQVLEDLAQDVVLAGLLEVGLHERPGRIRRCALSARPIRPAAHSPSARLRRAGRLELLLLIERENLFSKPRSRSSKVVMGSPKSVTQKRHNGRPHTLAASRARNRKASGAREVCAQTLRSANFPAPHIEARRRVGPAREGTATSARNSSFPTGPALADWRRRDDDIPPQEDLRGQGQDSLRGS